MAEPTKKSNDLNKFISKIAGNDRVSSIYADKCVLCSKVADTFRDALSRKEYRISGMCQGCQDNVFK